MSRLHDIDTVLRSLDSADDRIDPTSARARDDLRRILATAPEPETLEDSRPRSFDRIGRLSGPGRKIALAGVALAVLIAGVVAVPSLSGGDRAFATWTPAPTSLTPQERADAASECRENYVESMPEFTEALRSAEPVVAERRGVWTTVILAGPDGFDALCITDESGPFFAQSMIGSIGTPTDYSPPGSRELIATDLGTGQMDAGEVSIAAGFVGSDVIAVTYTSASHGEVAATVSHGRFALWMPGAETGGLVQRGSRG